MFKPLFAVLLLASAAAIAQSPVRQRVRDSFVVLDCVPMVKELQQFSTATILTATSNCVEQGRYADAARLLMLTTIAARFDAERGVGPERDDIPQILDRLLGEGHAPADLAGLAQAKRALSGDPEARRKLCAEIRAFGPPDDDSPYRDAPPPPSGASAFDAGRAWDTAVTAVLDCPG